MKGLNMKKIITNSLISLAVLIALSDSAVADVKNTGVVTGGYATAKIKRTCQAQYTGKVTGFSYGLNTSTGQMDNYLPIPITANVYFPFGGYFIAHGSCGKNVPNRCRKRSRDRLIKCARAQAQSPNRMPQLCRPDNIENYPSQQHMSAIEENACKPFKKNGILITTFPKPYQVHLLLSVFISGTKGKGCGRKGLGRSAVVDGQNVSISGSKNTYVSLPLKRYTITCD